MFFFLQLKSNCPAVNFLVANWLHGELTHFRLLTGGSATFLAWRNGTAEGMVPCERQARATPFAQAACNCRSHKWSCIRVRGPVPNRP